MSNLSKKSAAPSGPAFDPWLLWVALRRHWTWVTTAGIALATVGSLVVYFTFEPEYEATCILQANHDFVLSKDVIEPTKDLARNERFIILSPVVLGDVLLLPEIKNVPSLSDPLTRDTEIRKRLRISNGGADDLLMISYRDKDPAQAEKVADAIAEEYIEERRSYDDQRFKNIADSLRIPIEQLERKVKEGRDQLKKLSEKTTGIDPFKKSSDSSGRASYLDDLQKRSVDLDFEINVLTDRLESRQARLGKDPGSKFFLDRELKSYVSEDSAVRALREKVSYNDTAIRNIERKEQQGIFATRYKELKNELISLQSQLKDAEETARKNAEVALREEGGLRQQEIIEDLQTQIESLQAKRERVKSDIESERERLEKFSGETTELYFVRAQLDEDSEALSKARNRRISMELEQGRGPSITTRSAAKAPSAPIEETPIKKILLIGAIAFLIPFLLATLIEFKAKRITNADAIDTNQLIPILGEIARLPSGRKRSTGHRLFEESIDAMRANLLFKAEDVRSIAVTSAISGEGKSSIAFQLATSIARCTGERVLVIDADLRNPDQHDLFGLELGDGLCKLLTGESLLDKCIDCNTENELVHLLSAGKLDTNPHNLLTRSKFEHILQEVMNRYRYVVVDTAPILPAAETLTITGACDATLLCAMRDVSQSEHVKRTFGRLEETGANVIGTVFSGVPARTYASRYGDYRYSQSS